MLFPPRSAPVVDWAETLMLPRRRKAPRRRTGGRREEKSLAIVV